ncbi:hypothetical protein N7448_006649 [Penicillium atrosanguineum]|uniref:Uncharacterized protein n=1 Tax=Penicillium atrosanguineum TaxID=1132637 RepID=A0A9W9GZZ9_9EURO|nr:uncharacterized protein N7443_010410 [Penicillium atrosanguineum]KAJ5132491.1 hypothetical protein N7448_006649 [Penicillium atrosanguineum]KAJ5137296.1 hypothetical protein N7526_003529 [Penicillium atrosanguineum]KAJ5290157.1 hypothetical protein N7443_010410 [Penicillium atrosanguineum]KAJ5307981.1 hypothetical protein N7476_008637 [Penicillium atrosanguineum]
MSPKKVSSSERVHSRQTDDPKAALTPLTAPAQPTPLARIPSPARFFLVVLSSLLVSSVLHSLTSDLTLNDLGLVSKHLEEWWEVGVLVGWRAVEVGLAWAVGLDSWDAASFLFLTHMPTYTLLSFFYGVRPTSVLTSYAITIASTVIPFALLRRPSSVHDLSHAPSGAVANRTILQDHLTTIYTTLTATSIFSVMLYASYATWLPVQLVMHFESIPDISAAHAGPAGLPTLFLTLIPVGYAVRDFLFVSSAGNSTSSTEDEAKREERQGEVLFTAIYRKTWGQLSVKARILASRTLLLASVILLNTIVQVAGTIQSVSVEGAFVWGSVWAVATLAVGGVFAWVEAVDGV